MFLSGDMLPKYALDGGGGDAMTFGDLTEAVSLAAFPADGGLIENQGVAADVAAFEAGAPHAGAYPLDDEVALEFRDSTDDHDQGAA